jgi:hypothetical protein
MVDTWFLMGSPMPILGILTFYVSFVLKIGPKLMASRKPFNLKPLILFYNFSMILLSLYIVSMVFTEGLTSYLTFKNCNAKEISSEHKYAVQLGAWLYLISKIAELGDTIFFVLRKKNKQISFLHVYHHASQVGFVWAYLKYLPGEQAVIIAFLNSVVHVIMYFYYMVAAMGPKYQKYIWWKKYMTWIQLVQFVILLSYMVTVLVLQCNLPRLLTIFFIIQLTLFFCLFINFYLQTYKKKAVD